MGVGSAASDAGPEASALVQWRELLRFVEGLLFGDAGAVFGLELFGYLLDFAEDAEKIAAQDLAAVFSGVAARH